MKKYEKIINKFAKEFFLIFGSVLIISVISVKINNELYRFGIGILLILLAIYADRRSE